MAHLPARRLAGPGPVLGVHPLPVILGSPSAGCASTCPQMQAQSTGGTWQVILVTMALLGANLGEPGLSPSSATYTETLDRTLTLWTTVSLNNGAWSCTLQGCCEEWRPRRAGRSVCLWVGTGTAPPRTSQLRSEGQGASLPPEPSWVGASFMCLLQAVLPSYLPPEL